MAKQKKRARGNGAGTIFRRAGKGPWIARWYDHHGQRRERSTRTTDKATADRILREYIAQVALRREGLIDDTTDRLAEHERLPLATHLNDWTKSLSAKGVSTRQVKQLKGRVTKLMEIVRNERLSDFSASKIQTAIGEMHEKGMSLQTAHHYLRAVKQFSRWCFRDGRVRSDALAHLTGYNAATDRRYERRALSAEEMAHLIAIAATGPKVRTLAGPERAMLYRVAAGTGFRASELRSLTPQSLNLDDDPPTITVSAPHSKRRTEDVQPIRRDLAEQLHVFIEGMSHDAPLWPGSWHKKGAKMIRYDLRIARAHWIKATNIRAERRERRKSDFLAVADHLGRIADFHALRATYITLLIKGGGSIKQIQNLARHSDPTLTFGKYAPLRISDTASALDGLPSIDDRSGQRESAALRMTGTDDNPHLHPHQQQRDSTRNDATRCDAGLGDFKVTEPMFEPENKGKAVKNKERRGRDSNPRNIAVQRFSRPSP